MFSLPIPSMPGPGMGQPPMIGVPVGTVVAFAGQITSPSAEYKTNIEALGWMICDGRELEKGQYPELFAALGNLYGGQDEMFNLPDYRGYFLRGVDADGKHDPDTDKRIAPAGGQQTGVGSSQDDALQTHQHTYNKTELTTIVPGDTLPPTPVAGPPKAALTVEPIDKPNNPKISAHETRPKNIYVHYMIKYTYRQ